MSCLRCSNCGICWPDKAHYKPCPECHMPTDRFNNTDPDMSDEEAQSRWNHARFNDYLQENPGDWTKLDATEKRRMLAFAQRVERYKEEAATLIGIRRATVEQGGQSR